MKSVYIIARGILVMAAIVFLAPQETTNTEEEASISLNKIDAIILKEYRTDLTPGNEEIIRQKIVERLAKEKTEMRKYGRLPTAHERATQWWKKQDAAADRAAYAKLCAERKDWIDNFLFQPRYHQNLVFDPESNTAHSTEKFQVYREGLEKKSGKLWHGMKTKYWEIWARDDLSLEEKHKEEDNIRQEVKNARKPDPEITEQRRLLNRHKQLADFYEQQYPYLPEFGQAYRIFEEEGARENPIQIADTMVALESYKVASKHYPNQPHPASELWDNEIQDWKQPTFGEKLEREFHIIRNCVHS